MASRRQAEPNWWHVSRVRFRELRHTSEHRRPKAPRHIYPGHEKGPAAGAGERAALSSGFRSCNRPLSWPSDGGRSHSGPAARVRRGHGGAAGRRSDGMVRLPPPSLVPPPALGAARFGPSRRAPPGLPVTCAVDVELRVTVSPAEDGKFNVNVKGTTHIGAQRRRRRPSAAGLTSALFTQARGSPRRERRATCSCRETLSSGATCQMRASRSACAGWPRCAR